MNFRAADLTACGLRIIRRNGTVLYYEGKTKISREDFLRILDEYNKRNGSV